MTLDLVSRVRGALAALKPREQPMFGGTAFMIDGKMVASASRRGLLLRVGKNGQAAALAEPEAKAVKMGARAMSGYVRIAESVSDADLRRWLAVGVACVRALNAAAPAAKGRGARAGDREKT